MKFFEKILSRDGLKSEIREMRKAAKRAVKEMANFEKGADKAKKGLVRTREKLHELLEAEILPEELVPPLS